MSLLELVVNPNSGRNILPDCCTPETFADVRAFHRTLPGYQPTPLVALPDLAKEVGVKGVYIKDESKRFGLNAFKALGASYAIHKLFPNGNVGLTVTATDGNHGKGMAWSTHPHLPPGRCWLHGRRRGRLPGGDLQKSPRYGGGGGLGVRLRAGIYPPGQAGHH